MFQACLFLLGNRDREDETESSRKYEMAIQLLFIGRLFWLADCTAMPLWPTRSIPDAYFTLREPSLGCARREVWTVDST
jgi:hypothetical protein